MPGQKKNPSSSPRLRRPAASASVAKSAATRDAKSSRSRALLLIDNRPLQRAAWAEFHTARKRHEKAARDLHRHEEIDRPAYDAWLHRTFPVWVTTLRDLYAEVSTKSHQVRTVIFLAETTGRSLKKLWHEQKERAANPDAFNDEDDSDSNDPDSQKSSADHDPHDSSRDSDEDPFDDFFHDDPRSSRQSHRSASSAPAPGPSAKDIYRRLVQHLHPDRGGVWTPARQRLWHEVQQAWAAADADWLARLEVEWETANEVLGPDSPVSRLRRAITELIAARRDTERKLRKYRHSPHWRFTLSEKTRHLLHARTYANFRHDVEILQQQLNHLNRTIAAWEKDAPRKSRSR
ncbi:hypothetical protein CMV30_02580 [Nibricoccus aquaticus]|uniref:Uncharacterized protein n=1 Tax=Nibricoccus aquaticus TaxID=2576891 RepID=A0A290Q2P5_9BACT|nr:hypothetical protein [Nibricoccus aquaticus]ATC62935.1 hypothetical protein CMV30_02580 [Nibricoccus aquaticus]